MKEKWDYCPCDTCMYGEIMGTMDPSVCEQGHDEPFRSRGKIGCPDWDEGELDDP
jgi:hypothetical protein